MEPIKGFEGKYSIRPDGAVFSHLSNKFLKVDVWQSSSKNIRYHRVCLSDGRGRTVSKRVHRLLAEAYIPNPLNLPWVDHINRIGTDNRLENLRWCTVNQNQQNRGRKLNSSSRFKGVYWNGKNQAWIVESFIGKKRYRIGQFRVEEEAAKVYNEYAKKHFGEFAFLNEI